jgi:hypothetical protein
MKTHNSKLYENLEQGDLKRLVAPSLHIDEFKSKMGDDADICVLSIKIAGKEPATDLVNFIEKGYEFVLDADVSSGEKDGGDYLVFLEIERNPSMPEQIIQMLDDMMNLTTQELSEWTMRYRTSTTDHEVTADSIRKVVPLTPQAYSKKYEQDKDELDAMKAVAGVKIDTKAPVNDLTEMLRVAAGLK